MLTSRPQMPDAQRLQAEISSVQERIKTAETETRREYLATVLADLTSQLNQVQRSPVAVVQPFAPGSHPIDMQLAQMLRGNFDEGWKISEYLQSLGPDNIPDSSGVPNPEMWLRHNFNRGWFLLNQGKFQEGMQLLESGRWLSVYGSPQLTNKIPIWQGQPAHGKTIILSLEGGYGDEIIHARFAGKLADAGATVVVAADSGLHSLFYTIRGVSQCVSHTAAKQVQADYWLPGFSAAWVSGVNYDTLSGAPYLSANPRLIDKWTDILKRSNGRPKVGIRWSGNPEFEHQQFRKFPPEFLLDIAKHEEIDVYSFQRDTDILNLPSNIIDLQFMLTSWDETAAAIMNLDLMITSCTSVAHLAGALGKPTWVLPPILPYHTWTLGAPQSRTSPWYDTITLYRQGSYRDWSGTFNQLYVDLKNKFGLKGNLPVVSPPDQATLNTMPNVNFSGR